MKKMELPELDFVSFFTDDVIVTSCSEYVNDCLTDCGNNCTTVCTGYNCPAHCGGDCFDDSCFQECSGYCSDDRGERCFVEDLSMD
ncbi:MAG: hypothetical protein CW338_01705 [Clostridiales bacterium]|nr:hypothetical protein [Clostridiales bacterium]